MQTLRRYIFLTNTLTVLTLEWLQGIKSNYREQPRLHGFYKEEIEMRKKYLAIAALTLAMTAGSAMTSFAAGFVHTPQGTKYQWGSGDYCTNNWVSYHNNWYFFGNDQLMRTGWIQRDGTWYFASNTGELQGGIMKINGNVYYFDGNTLKLATGNHTYNGVSYDFTDNGTKGGAPYVYTEWNSNGTLKRGTSFPAR